MEEALRVDESRYKQFGETGIFVRAVRPTGVWVNADIVDLTEDSLNRWLRSRGGENAWAEAVVRLLLGYTPDLSEGSRT